MKFMVEYPIQSDVDGGAWLDPANIAAFARTAEEAGLSAIAVTDHPAPSKKWLDNGGHETFDPFVALGFWAAATSRIRLMTYLAVVPYRNPLLLAKSMTSVDVLSGGRATFVLGAGYLRSEFAALGVDFAERNELFDESVEVLRGIWSTDEFSHQGKHFSSRGQIIKPGPVQLPHPPLWLGGNAAVVRERVAAWGQGWAPLQGSAQLSQTTRTPGIESEDDLVAMLDDLDERLAAHGRSRSDIDVCAKVGARWTDGSDAYLEALAGLSKLGVTWTSVPVVLDSFAAALEGLQRFGVDVIAKH